MTKYLLLIAIHFSVMNFCSMASTGHSPYDTKDDGPKINMPVKKHPIYKTPEELREACKPLLKPPTPKAMHYDEKQLFIVDYLDSEDPKMRDKAADILAEFVMYQRPMRLSAVTKYLSEEYPLNVRVAALVHSLCFRFGGGENPTMEEQRALREKMKEPWSKVMNDIAEHSIEPLYVDALVYVMRIKSHARRVELIKAENQPIMIKRFLNVMSQESSAYRRQSIIRMICDFPTDVVVEELLLWYSAEKDRDIRLTVVDHFEFLSRGSKRTMLLKFKPIIELAAKDEDEEIAKKAKALLEKMEE